ncbi:MAG TPA: cytochrome P460 family protein [Spirochaetota bacterium]|nr:cytochrome P460 family protein [Spirochaetota bacterium]HPJ36378.1 cytochrome P460 family protein [Spirochaetota bacterium]
MKPAVFAMCLLLPLMLFIKCGGERSFQIPDYKTWNKVIPQVLDRPVPGHGATFRVIYANETAFSSEIVTDDTGVRSVKMKDGSIIVKEVYKKREDVGYKVPDLLIMEKRGSDPESLNGWRYYLKKPAEKTVEVRTRMCVGCHEAANEKHPYFDGNRDEIFRDYLFISIAK